MSPPTPQAGEPSTPQPTVPSRRLVERLAAAEQARDSAQSDERQAVGRATRAEEVASAARTALAHEEQLRISAEEAARRLEAYMTALAHDLRTPLTTIGIAVDYMLRTSDGSRDATVLQRIAASAQRMAVMTDTIRDFALIGLGVGLQPRRRHVDLHAVASGVLHELSDLAGTGRVELDARGDVRGEWDDSLLARMVSNLVLNAVQHGDPSTPIRVSLAAEGDTVRLEVHNLGPPIAAPLLPVLFEPFRRGHGAREIAASDSASTSRARSRGPTVVESASSRTRPRGPRSPCGSHKKNKNNHKKGARHHGAGRRG
jgi:signal transduction histidine kinase